jgi:hypothetical protein
MIAFIDLWIKCQQLFLICIQVNRASLDCLIICFRHLYLVYQYHMILNDLCVYVMF